MWFGRPRASNHDCGDLLLLEDGIVGCKVGLVAIMAVDVVASSTVFLTPKIPGNRGWKLRRVRITSGASRPTIRLGYLLFVTNTPAIISPVSKIEHSTFRHVFYKRWVPYKMYLC